MKKRGKRETNEKNRRAEEKRREERKGKESIEIREKNAPFGN
jgi:hypothetical protein